MIFDNHEEQLPFLREAVEKLSNNYKNSTLTLRGRVCLSKKCAVFAFGDAMQRSGQPAAFPTALFGLYGATSEGYRPCSQDTIPRNHLNKTIKNCPHELHKPMSARGSKLELILLNEIVL